MASPEQIIAATLSQPTNIAEQIYTVIFSLIVVLATAALWIRRKLSKDTLEINKDRAEGGLIDHLTKERDVLKEEKERLLSNLLAVDKDRQEARASVSALTVEVEHLRAQVAEMREVIEDLRHQVRVATSAMQEMAIENARMTEKLGTIREIFAMKCDACSFKPKDAQGCGVPADVQTAIELKLKREGQ